jgi:hypothetical protein
MKLPGEEEPDTEVVAPAVIPDPVAPEDPNCPRSKRDSTVDPKRQQDCSPAIATRCYDNSAGLYRNSRCPAGSACGQWTQTIGGSAYYINGCVLIQYCNTNGDYNTDLNVEFKCPDPNPPTPAPTSDVPTTVPDATDETPTAPEGTKCTLA